MSSEPVIQFENVHKAFNGLQVLRGVDLSVARGAVTTIIGRSGVGKSVLLKHVVGLLKPDRGAVLIEGRQLDTMRRRERRALKAKLSYMFQQMALFDSMTVYENIALPLEERTKLPRRAIHGRVAELVELMELGDILGKYPAELSGGMSKRVAFARSLITEPEIMLFDEPTTGLDPMRKAMVHEMIARHQQEKGFTAVIVSHDIPEVFEVSQHVALLDKGVIVAQGPPGDFIESADERVRRFVEGEAELVQAS